ncbi:hypothetical protein C8Q76DRAFT_722583 [Earliella scabrosa]|nr:hypothetical protein C8Q76DRAFT_722583 [Earliella scabrosa]
MDLPEQRPPCRDASSAVHSLSPKWPGGSLDPFHWKPSGWTGASSSSLSARLHGWELAATSAACRNCGRALGWTGVRAWPRHERMQRAGCTVGTAHTQHIIGLRQQSEQGTNGKGRAGVQITGREARPRTASTNWESTGRIAGTSPTRHHRHWTALAATPIDVARTRTPDCCEARPDRVTRDGGARITRGVLRRSVHVRYTVGVRVQFRGRVEGPAEAGPGSRRRILAFLANAMSWGVSPNYSRPQLHRPSAAVRSGSAVGRAESNYIVRTANATQMQMMES